MKIASWFTRKMLIAQTIWSGLQYSLVSEDDKQCHPFVYCKEFVLDAVWSTVTSRVSTIFGFVYHPEFDPRVALSECRLMLRNREDPKFIERLPNMVKFLNALEHKMGFTLSKIEKVENSDSEIWLLRSSNKWFLAPPLTSMLTLLIRIGMIYDGKMNVWKHCGKVINKETKPYQYRDEDHLRRSIDVIKELVETGVERRFGISTSANWAIPVKGWDIHENTGIVSLATGKAKVLCPRWYPEVKKDETEAIVCS